MTAVRRSFTLDRLLVLKDRGLMSSSGVMPSLYQEGPGWPAAVVWLGGGSVDGTVLLQIDSIETGSGDERFDIILQGCNDANFSGPIVNLAMMAFGAGAVLPGGVSTTTAGTTFEMGFCNVVNGEGYEWVRLFLEVYGTISSGINFRAFITNSGSV